MGARRILAGLLDMALLVLPGVLMLLLSETAMFVFIAVFPILATLYFAGFHLRTAQTPGKRALNLRVVGHGCILCRELRKCAILFAPIVFGLLEAIATTTPILAIGLIFVLDYGWPLLLVLGLSFTLFPVITLLFNKSPHWDRATGFSVVPAPPSR